jgi:hypothetical protein
MGETEKSRKEGCLKVVAGHEGGRSMKRMSLFVLPTIAACAIAAMPFAGGGDEKAAPIIEIKLPHGYRDWRLISVAHEAGNNNDLPRHSGQRFSDQDLPGRETAVSGWHNYCPAGMELRRV